MTEKNSEQIISELLTEIEELRQENQTLRDQACPWCNDDKSICSNLTLDSFDAFIVVDAESGIVTGLNKNAETLFGWPQSKLMGMHFSDLHLLANEEADDLPSLADLIATAENGLQASIMTASGVVRHTLIVAQPLRSNIRPKTLVQYHDITNSVEVHDDFLKLFDLSLDIICVADINKEIFERVNPAFTRILGYPLEEVEGKPYLDFLHPDDIEPTAAVVEKQLKDGKDVIDFQNRHRCKSGEYRWLQWFTHPDLNKGKNYAVGRDITDAKRIEEELRISKERYTSLYNAMHEGMAIHEMVYDSEAVAIDYRILEVNSRYEAILGIPRNEAIGSLGTQLYGVAEAPYLEEVAEVVCSGEPTSFQAYFPPMDKHFHISFIRIKKDTFASIFEDLTDFLRTREQLEQSLQELSNTRILLKTVFQQAPVPMAVVKPDMSLDIVNSAARKMFRIAEDYPIEGSNILELPKTWIAYDSSGNVITKEQNHLLLGLKGLSTQGEEVKIQRNDGTESWCMIYTSPIYNENNELIAAFSSFPDITERQIMEMELHRMATTDPLTGSSNRRRFMECAEEEFSRARRYCTKMTLLTMDIDHFKDVNDSYGHHVGDAVLKDLVTQCRSILRTTDVFARMGGEEFSALLIQTDITGAQIIAERLRGALQDHNCKMEGQNVRITISVGLSELREDDNSIQEIMRRSDKALYKAKGGGRNRVEVE